MKRSVNPSTLQRIRSGAVEKREHHAPVNQRVIEHKGGKFTVTETKKKWLKQHLSSVKWDKITIVRYGVNKSTLGNGILFDDEEPNRNMWGKGAYDVNNILEILKEL